MTGPEIFQFVDTDHICDLDDMQHNGRCAYCGTYNASYDTSGSDSHKVDMESRRAGLLATEARYAELAQSQTADPSRRFGRKASHCAAMANALKSYLIHRDALKALQIDC